jgi:hypothetical protein
MTEFTSFQDIEGLHNVTKHFRVPFEMTQYEITYAPKVKLHGTNAGYAMETGPDGELKIMKRSGFITPEADNFGFAQYVADNAWLISAAMQNGINFVYAMDPTPVKKVEVWGEWVGKGIQKGVALAQLDDKYFAPFMVILTYEEEGRVKLVDPGIIFQFTAFVPRIVPIEWSDFRFAFDLVTKQAIIRQDEDNFYVGLDELNQLVERVDAICPWSKKHFGVEGPGEGYVLYPVSITTTINGVTSNVPPHEIDYSRLMFKAKGEGHKVVKNKAAVIVDPEKVAKHSEFAEKFVTEARCQQGAQLVGGADIKNMSAFLKWIGNDVIKESKDDLEVSGMEWKDVAKGVTMKAAAWFKTEAMKV